VFPTLPADTAAHKDCDHCYRKQPGQHSGRPKEKGCEMRRVIFSLAGALLAVTAATTSASAAPPIDVNAEPGSGGVTVTATVDGTPIEQITTGQLANDEEPPSTDNGHPGLCATGVIHTSCTPASEAAPNK
jgi:hypothetical protein